MMMDAFKQEIIILKVILEFENVLMKFANDDGVIIIMIFGDDDIVMVVVVLQEMKIIVLTMSEAFEVSVDGVCR